jgi:hypothetical protein
MHGRLRALALIVGLSAIPFQASPTHADEVCEVVGTAGVFRIADGKDTDRQWRFIADGMIYSSDRFDKLNLSTTKVKKSNGKTVKETVLAFKDKSSVTRTPNDDNGAAVDVVLTGTIAESDRSGEIILTDRTNAKEYKITDPSGGFKIACTTS